MFWDEPDSRSRQDLLEQIAFITGDDIQQTAEITRAYDLTYREARLLLVLKNASGRTLSRETLIRRLYDDRLEDEVPDLKMIDIWICKLRKKLPDSMTIKTSWCVQSRGRATAMSSSSTGLCWVASPKPAPARSRLPGVMAECGKSTSPSIRTIGI
jgi:hypothetical protein